MSKKLMCKSFIDGLNAGISLENPEIDISKNTYLYMRKAFLRMGAKSKGKKFLDLTITNPVVGVDDAKHTKLIVNEFGGRYYFNVQGNPISFLSGQNVFGYSNLPDLVTSFYKACGRIMKRLWKDFKMPAEIRSTVENMNVYTSRLAVTNYSNKLLLKDGQLKHFYDNVEHIYSSHPDGVNRASLCEILGVKLQRDGDYSILFKKTNKYGKNVWSLRLYDKAEELRSRDIAAPACLGGTIRFDLTLFSPWFSGHKLKTVGAIHNHVVKRHGVSSNMDGIYVSWINSLIKFSVNEVKLNYIHSCRLPRPEDMGEFRDAYLSWQKGTRFSVKDAATEFFRTRGFDMTLPPAFYSVVSGAKSTFHFMGEDDIENLLNYDPDSTKKLADKLRQRFAEQAAITFSKSSDPKFLHYLGWDGGFVDSTTGEVLG